MKLITRGNNPSKRSTSFEVFQAVNPDTKECYYRRAGHLWKGVAENYKRGWLWHDCKNLRDSPKMYNTWR